MNGNRVPGVFATSRQHADNGGHLKCHSFFFPTDVAINAPDIPVLNFHAVRNAGRSRNETERPLEVDYIYFNQS